MHKLLRGAVVLSGLLLFAACGEEQTADAPEPTELTRDAIGHYCNMIVEDHEGPKGQIFLANSNEPIWFSSVRDTIAFTMLPEEPKKIAAIYVNDMGRATWEKPEAGTWIDARSAWYVIGSVRRGGMGAPEAVPFAEREAAEAFSNSYGGTVIAFTDIPQSEILGDVNEQSAEAGHDMSQGQSGMEHDESMAHGASAEGDHGMNQGDEKKEDAAQ